MAIRLFIGNVPDFCTENQLESTFSEYGKVVGIDIKSKNDSTGDSGNHKFAFINLETTLENVNNCINYFGKQEWNGSKLYVTRARESFLERLKREREEAASKKEHKSEVHQNKKLVVNIQPRKLKIPNPPKNSKITESIDDAPKTVQRALKSPERKLDLKSEKKKNAELKRLESMRKKREEFNEKKLLIKKGLENVDKKQNKKIKFDLDAIEMVPNEFLKPHYLPKINGDAVPTNGILKQSKLFDERSEDEEVEDDFHFQVREQFEGVQGQKLLELQSKYKSDKRFNLDERFMESDSRNDRIDAQIDPTEKEQQLDILERVLGIQVKRAEYHVESDRKKKTSAKLGMPRFDPSRPEHTKHLAEITTKPQESKKKKKEKKDKKIELEAKEKIEEKKVEVSKEVFYKVSDTLKESLVQPTQFSLRSLFGTSNEEYDEVEKQKPEQQADYTPLVVPKKAKNPLDRPDKNPFVYDSSASEDEQPDESVRVQSEDTKNVQTKAVWKENLFFDDCDDRLQEGLAFFNNTELPARTERRELKFVMKKRLNNHSRNETMFKKKIGGKRRGGGANRRGSGRGRGGRR